MTIGGGALPVNPSVERNVRGSAATVVVQGVERCEQLSDAMILEGPVGGK